MKQLGLLFSYIYPNYCGICGKLNEDCLCKKCEIQLNKNKKIKTEKYIDEPFESHTYLFLYQGIIRDKIIEYKFQNKAYLARMFAKLIWNEESIVKKMENYDYIIPVPIHKKRKQQRGYNQSELMLKYIICEKNRINTKLLKKEINNLPQSSLNKENRKQNVLGVYAFQYKMEEIIKGKTILVFDDIFTTGNTVKECSKILKNAGANKIDILTIAKD